MLILNKTIKSLPLKVTFSGRLLFIFEVYFRWHASNSSADSILPTIGSGSMP